MLNWRIAQGVYKALAYTVADGKPSPLALDLDGVLKVREVGSPPSGASSVYKSPLATSGVIKASAGFLRQIQGRSMANAGRWLMYFDATSVPANGATPAWPSIPLLSTLPSGFPFGFMYQEMPFATGIAWAVSTTAETLTLTLGTDVALGALYV